jgi:type I restriction enzyme S subunit
LAQKRSGDAVKAGWELKALGDICDIAPKKILVKQRLSDTQTVSFVPMDHLGELERDFLPKEDRELGSVYKGYTYFADDDVIVAKITPCFENGKMGVAKGMTNGVGFGSSEFVPIRGRGDTVPEYLFYYLLRDEFRQVGARVMSGAVGHKRVPKEYLEMLPIPLPPLDEQKRIVAVLDAAFEGLTRARTHVETNLQNARELFGNLLDAVFTDCPDHWAKSNLGETCRFVGGSQPPKSNFVAEPGEGLVRLVQIRDYKSDKNIVYVPRSLVRRFCSPDDVMIGRYGPPLFQILRGIDGAYNVALMKAEPDETKISKDFLYLFLRNSRIWRYINDASSRAAGQIGLNKATIEPYPIAYPNLEEQEVVVKRLAEAESDCKQAEALYKTKLQDLDDLRQSLLQKAFAGKLT